MIHAIVHNLSIAGIGGSSVQTERREERETSRAKSNESRESCEPVATTSPQH